MDSNFHENLLASLTELSEQLQELTNSTETRSGTGQDNYLSCGIPEVMDSYNYSMGGLHTFLNSLDAEISVLDKELDDLNTERNSLLAERDVLIEKGHELNCRLGYNALERKLDETFTSLEKYTSEDSAKCFRDEAEERVKRTTDLVRVASMTSCHIDRDIYKEMEKITNLFENYERDREYYVKELDLFSDVRRQRISAWLAGSCTEEEREKGENVLDYLNLSQRQRHMEAQVIKNALRMYSFNASLNFDREDNLKLMEELTAIQNKVNSQSGVNVILPRAARAKTDLTIAAGLEKAGSDEGASGDMKVTETAPGKGLHRCSRQVNLATDPVTDPDIVARLEAALRWEDREESSALTPTCDGGESTSEHHEDTLVRSPSGSSSITEVIIPKTGESVCGDADACAMLMEPSALEIALANDGKTSKKISDSKQAEPRITHTVLRHIESPTVLPAAADRQIVGLVRKKHSSNRPVGSLTNVLDVEKNSSSQRLPHEYEERDTRSQGNEGTGSRPSSSTSGNRSREYNVPGNWEKE